MTTFNWNVKTSQTEPLLEQVEPDRYVPLSGEPSAEGSVEGPAHNFGNRLTGVEIETEILNETVTKLKKQLKKLKKFVGKASQYNHTK